jgi:peptide/nickel transport system permease protein
MTAVDKSAALPGRNPMNDPGPAMRFIKKLGRGAKAEPLAFALGVLLLGIVILAVFAPVLVQHQPTKLVADPLESPSFSHFLGTDEYGRDVFSRLVYGGRLSLLVGLLATVMSIFLALIIGSVSAYLGGVFDYFIQRLVDVVQALPAIVLLLAIVVALGPSATTIVIALGFRGGVVGSRIVRGATLSLRRTDFVLAAKSTGASDLRILVRHLYPNLLPLALVLASVSLSANVIAEASISFLGFGVQPPQATWGRMLSDARIYMLSAPMLVVWPSIALAIVVLSANIIGDAIRDRLDPRLRNT